MIHRSVRLDVRKRSTAVFFTPDTSIGGLKLVISSKTYTKVMVIILMLIVANKLAQGVFKREEEVGLVDQEELKRNRAEAESTVVYLNVSV